MVSDRNAGLLVIVIVIFMFGSNFIGVATAASNASQTNRTAAPAGARNFINRPMSGEMVLMIFQKIYLIGTSMIQAQDNVIFRLKKIKPINAVRVKTRILSGQNQIRSLLYRGCKYQLLLSSTNSKLSEIEAAKQRLPDLKREYQDNCTQIEGRIGSGTGDLSSLSSLFSGSADFFDPPSDISSASFQMESLDDGL
ncbi:MAG: hypothetical protein HQM09_03795 [Candidatus Riflebacteria bacterium]|nr:hypothetical protein [Candidatus Riflebacteria bacterium]